MAEFEFRGTAELLYPGFKHPEVDGALHAEPGEVVDFGDQLLPPDDGRWYSAKTGEVYAPEPPVVSGEVSLVQPTHEDPED